MVRSLDAETAPSLLSTRELRRPLVTGSGTLASLEPSEELLFSGRPALVPSFGALLLCVLTLGLWLLPLWWKKRGMNYRVTSRRIVVERGVLSQRLDQVDLYRINDYAVERPFSQRLLGTGNLLLKTLDKTTPELALIGIRTDVIALYERLRAATETEKLRRGVRVFDLE